MKKRQLLEVRWTDITTDGFWQDEDVDCTEHGIEMFSVGWKLKSNKKVLVLTPMRTKATDRCADRQIIPRGCIKSIRRIE